MQAPNKNNSSACSLEKNIYMSGRGEIIMMTFGSPKPYGIKVDNIIPYMLGGI
jgi:hypothetical protein